MGLLDRDRILAFRDREKRLEDARAEIETLRAALKALEEKDDAKHPERPGLLKQQIKEHEAACEELELACAEDHEYVGAQRRMFVTDLLFACHVLGYTKIDADIHADAIGCFIKKDPDKTLVETIAANRDREGVLLYPRGTYKTTLNVADSVQWIVGYPNVTIAHLTATAGLGKAIVEEICQHFIRGNGAVASDFQLLFPEHLIVPKDVLTGQFTTPARTVYDRSPSVMAISIEQSLSGWHFWIMKPDDPVDNRNSGTPESIRKVNNNFGINKKMLMPGGDLLDIGTRYGPFDLHGERIRNARPGNRRIVVKAALTVISGERLQAGMFPARDEVILNFETLGLTYDFLKKEFEEDYSSFMTQFQNDAHGGNEVVFTREQIAECAIPEENIPVLGDRVMVWRFAFNDKASMRYACGGVGMLANGRLHVVDVERGVYQPSRLAAALVAMAQRHGIHRVRIEATPGALHMDAALHNEAGRMGWNLNIEWIDYEESDGVRDLRLKAIEPKLAERRVLFSSDLSAWAEMLRQFENYGMVEENDIVDVVARMSDYLPASILAEDEDAKYMEIWETMKQRDQHDRVYGLGNYAPMDDPGPETPEPQQWDPFATDIAGMVN